MLQQSRDLRFHDDFAGTFPCTTANEGQIGSGISPPTVSCPLAAATNIIGNFCSVRSLAFERRDTSSFGPPKALVPFVAASMDHDSTRSDDFIVAS
jgi:hypothetical protein